MGGNFIKIDRKILKWEWWSDINTFRLFVYMLLSAWWKDGNYKGVEILRGSFPSSIPELAKETNLTENEIRTALKHLKTTGEITGKSTNKFTVFTVKNYDLYQSINRQDCEQTTGEITDNAQADNRQLTDKSQAINRQITNLPIIKEYKNIRIQEDKELKKERIEEDIIPPLSPLEGETQTPKRARRFVPPTLDEVERYCFEKNNGVDAQAFIDFYESKGWMIGKNKMKDWKAAVRTWERKRKEERSSNAYRSSYGNSRDEQFNSLMEQIRRDEEYDS